MCLESEARCSRRNRQPSPVLVRLKERRRPRQNFRISKGSRRLPSGSPAPVQVGYWAGSPGLRMGGEVEKGSREEGASHKDALSVWFSVSHFMPLVSVSSKSQGHQSPALCPYL